MIIITGTKRAGTSMWMQILQAAGLSTIGSAFGQHWEGTIKEANPLGFHESILRRGIYYATNPHPETGRWLNPNAVKNVGVKVFIPGVIRSDVVYLNRVIATVRPVQQYVQSLERLQKMERQELEGRGEEAASQRLAPAHEWWLENFLLVRDLITRKYPFRLLAYERVLESPERIVPAVLKWLGSGDPDSACTAVSQSVRTAQEQESSGVKLPAQVLEVSQEFYERVYSGQPFDNAFLNRMNSAHQLMLPLIEEELRHAAAVASPSVGGNVMSPDTLEDLIHAK